MARVRQLVPFRHHSNVEWHANISLRPFLGGRGRVDIHDDEHTYDVHIYIYLHTHAHVGNII